MSEIAVIGAGPAGLAAAQVLAEAGKRPVVLERDDIVGGLSRTVNLHGYRFDIGGHRFFTKIPEVQDLWRELMGDDLLVRERMSRIFYRGRMMDYPLRAMSALRTLGILDSARAMTSYVAARMRPVPDDSFEGWITNRFGRRLYEHFFKAYTEKIWGMPCTEISADWAAQRIKSLTLWGAIRDAVLPGRNAEHLSLLKQFSYPRLGPGMLFERLAERVEDAGGRILTDRRVTGLDLDGERVTSISIEGPDGGEELEVAGLVSTMPLGELVAAMGGQVAPRAAEAAATLRQRGFLTAGLVLDSPDPFPDQWIYVHEPDVRVGRVQNYRNWSPEMVPDPSKAAIGCEYFCWTSDDLWSAPDNEIIELAAREMEGLGLIPADTVVDGTVVRMADAYPVYDPGYLEQVAAVREALTGISNLQVAGRGGMHRYNNMDHSIMTGWLAARSLLGESHDVWSVNADPDYLETK